jgi:hypothetical protein
MPKLKVPGVVSPSPRVFISMRRDCVSELRPLNGPVVNPPDSGEPRRNDTDRGKSYPSATFSTINPTWTDPGANPCLRDRDA